MSADAFMGLLVALFEYCIIVGGALFAAILVFLYVSD